MLSLPELQSRFFRSIARVSSPGEEWQGFDPTLVQLVWGSGQLDPAERLDIYAQMYCARLLDILQEDFPRLTAILGEERFRAIGREYLRQFPSTHPSVRYLGARFASFVSTQDEIVSLPFLADLARLEWARLEMFDAPDAEPLRLNHLQAVPPDEWPSLRFRLIPALQLLQCGWPVDTIWAAAGTIRQDEPIQPTETVLRIWRQDFLVYHSRMDAIEQAALAGVRAGASFAEVCARVESLLPSQDAAHTVGSLLLRWIEDGILAREYED